MTFEQGFALVITWAKKAASLGLLAYVLVIIAKLFGISTVQIQSADLQALGVFLAGTAFALSKL